MQTTPKVNNIYKMLNKTNWPQKTKCNNTDPPQQAHWVRIILGKLDIIQYPHTAINFPMGFPDNMAITWKNPTFSQPNDIDNSNNARDI